MRLGLRGFAHRVRRVRLGVAESPNNPVLRRPRSENEPKPLVGFFAWAAAWEAKRRELVSSDGRALGRPRAKSSIVWPRAKGDCVIRGGKDRLRRVCFFLCVYCD
jgi:hypothetical protein